MYKPSKKQISLIIILGLIATISIAIYFYKKDSVEKTYVTPDPVSTVSVEEQFPSPSDADRNEAKIKVRQKAYGITLQEWQSQYENKSGYEIVSSDSGDKKTDGSGFYYRLFEENKRLDIINQNLGSKNLREFSQVLKEVGIDVKGDDFDHRSNKKLSMPSVYVNGLGFVNLLASGTEIKGIFISPSLITTDKEKISTINQFITNHREYLGKPTFSFVDKINKGYTIDFYKEINLVFFDNRFIILSKDFVIDEEFVKFIGIDYYRPTTRCGFQICIR